MGILARNDELKRWRHAAAVQPFPHILLILSFSMLGVAVAYFGLLYLIVR